MALDGIDSTRVMPDFTRMTVARLREAIGLDQRALADALGVSVRTITRWEKRGTASHPIWMRRLALMAEERYAQREQEQDVGR